MSAISTNYIEELGVLTVNNARHGRGAQVEPALLERRFRSVEEVNLRLVFTADFTALLPAAADGTDLGFTPGAHGTNTPCIVSGDPSGATVTEKCRFMSVVPRLDGDIYLGILCISAANLVESHTLDVEIYSSDGAGGKDPADDLVQTAAIDLNNAAGLVLGWRVFELDESLFPYDVARLDVEITVDADDTPLGANAGIVTIGGIAWGHVKPT